MSEATIYQSGEYLASNPTWHSEDAPFKAEQVLRAFARSGMTPKRICDIGCGSGDVLQIVSRAMPDCACVGYEHSPQALELAAPKATERLSFKAGNPAERYDVAMALDVFEHVEDYIGFIRDMGGISDHQLFHIPLDISVQAVVRRTPLAWARQSVGHLHFFTKELAIESIEHAGLSIVDWFYTAEHAHKISTEGALRTRVAGLPRNLAYALFPDLAVRWLGGYSLLVVSRSG